MHNLIKDYPRAAVLVLLGLITVCGSLIGYGWKENIDVRKENTCAVRDLTTLMTKWSVKTEGLEEDVEAIKVIDHEQSADIHDHEIRLTKLEN